jgi:hypothetical protein
MRIICFYTKKIVGQHLIFVCVGSKKPCSVRLGVGCGASNKLVSSITQVERALGRRDVTTKPDLRASSLPR